LKPILDMPALPSRFRRLPAQPGVALALASVLSLVVGSRLAAAEPVSWFREVTPLFKRSCNGCHNPNKLKGEVDTSTYAGFLKPGKNGANFVPGDPAKSLVLSEVSGKEPSMPKEGDPLSPAEIALLERWIREGAKDDTPADAYSTRLTEPPRYEALPVLTALAVSPDGRWLATSGYHEVLVFSLPDYERVGRWVGEATRIESLAFSPDSKHLAVAGGVPARAGQIQVWSVETGKSAAAWTLSADSLYGVSWSPTGDRLAFGGADKAVRIVGFPGGKELMRFDNHSDWSLQTAWLPTGQRILSGSRDRAVKLIDATNGQFIDDINKLLEPVTCLTRHPKDESVAYGGAEGGLRIYRAKENQERTDGNRDVNLVREFERQPGAVQSVAFSPDGAWLAAGLPKGEVRLYQTSDGKRGATLGGHDGAVFSLAFAPDGKHLFTGSFDGLIREFTVPDGKLVGLVQSAPLSPATPTQSASARP
jgi:mono/diheme cytochrome c family protein